MHHAITLDALRVLNAIQQKGSFAQAAKSLFKVPSALTYTMQKLETDLGVELFNRNGQRAVLTEAGELLLAEGQTLLAAASKLEQKVRQVESGWETKLVISKDTIIANQPVLDVMQRFCLMDKHVEISLFEEALGGGWDALHSQRCDIAIGVTGELPKGQYEVHKMGEVEFVFAVANHHPLANYVGVLEAEQMFDFPAVVVADSARILPARSHGLFESKQIIRVQNMSAKIDTQVSGLGIGFLPRHLIQQQVEQQQLVIKTTYLHRPLIPVYIAWNKQQPGKALNWFIQQCKQQDWLL
ncbi:LysR family transcriptional regulator [Aliiglaciecola sp. LCG003]|uniref:LysR family transcriptional regulator n=1 Tax=Aliiglaciecola sp. LCG003 TaxID=3053655 RepID=UPI00257462FC|nr:LysR family transcriptional regulator [Aliiglaciecola sp. LCG003]WJG09159.1 LysR family transcriptional regulator [Aliiglaciecola sp. LCG003]